MAEPRPVRPAADAAGPDTEGEGGGRKRRRRGRRGGRGRRRGPGLEGAAPIAGAPELNGGDADFGVEDFAPDETPVHEAPIHEMRQPELPPPPVSEAASPVHAWAPPAAPVRHEAEPEPAYAARETRDTRDTMSPAPTREPRADRGERHRPRPESTPDMNTDELSSTSQRLTEELLRAMGFEPRVSVRAEGNRVDVTVEVDRDDDLLNGRLGETRQALQHLLNRFLNKGDGSRYHLQLEVNDHWQQRESELTELAHRLAEEAATGQVEVVSDHLNSQERRIVHMTLREDSRVKTYSLGMGAVKRVAVAPASFPDRSEDDPAS
jgi:spoIIIJ-associated protein